MEQYLIVCPLIFLAGLVDSIAGGGGLISLPAYLIAGVPPHSALATNKMGSTMGTVVSTTRFIRNGYVDFKVAIPAAVASVIGAFLGVKITLRMDESVVRHMMLIILPIVAIYVLRNKNMGDNERTGTLTQGKKTAVTIAVALALGIYDGFYGPGTGTFLILLLTGAARMDIKSASGVTKVLNLSSNVSALITFIFSGKVYFSLGLAAGLFCIAGHYIGSGMVMAGGKKVVRPIILLVLIILFIKVISELIAK
ncbi:TSUP family transporter [Clostridium sp. AM58-1XD]|uniref:sulfite exporter TauE/SafE family protein n=1 Tax=Clostridium sp. AM58-1XD TaxID=2292307 RepID=UPI000E46E9F6|nr:TSUP family transporter [Clostridium sp. AM58-1XD]RGY97026.1 sulfite exporter TauE/SafE family protein [Clostridium sp. AM58-1XD]